MKVSISNFFKKNRLLIVILLLGLFLRSYGAKELFLYSHDQDLAGWVIKDVLVNKHLRLIGQETTAQGIFIGPLFYYSLIPFYLLFGLDPIGGVVMVTLIGALSILSFYFVFTKVFDRRVGILSAFIYATSFYTIFVDREVVPTTPVLLWSVWFFYAINLLLKGKQRIAFPLLGFLVGLTWHFSLGLAILVLLIPLAFFLSKKKLDFRSILTGALTLFITSIPLIVFEFRHGFQQTVAVLNTLIPGQAEGGVSSFSRVITLVSKNANSLFSGPVLRVTDKYGFYLLLGILLFLIVKKILDKSLAIVIFAWLAIYVVFFSLNSIILSEYYFNGMIVIWIGIVSIFLGYLLRNKRYKKWVFGAVLFFLVINLYRFFSLDVNRSGYLERKRLVSFIKEDAKRNSFPCISVSYITDPGYNLGYRYLFWLENMHVNNPGSGSPVYTIVFPLKSIFPEDKSFGALGLILPDYERYLPEAVQKSCSGENSNLVDPMFGYTE